MNPFSIYNGLNQEHSHIFCVYCVFVLSSVCVQDAADLKVTLSCHLVVIFCHYRGFPI